MTLPRLASPRCFVWLEQVIAANMAKLFRGTKILGVWAFRVTRDADIEISADEAADLRDRVEQGVRERGFLDVVRLEVDSAMPKAIRAILTDNLSLQDGDVWRIDGPLDMSKLWELHKLNLPAIKDAPLTPRIPAGIDRRSDFCAHRAERRALASPV